MFKTTLSKSLLLTSALALITAPALAATKYSFTDGQTVTLTGTVSHIDDDEFVLTYNAASDLQVKVDLDEWDDSADARTFLRDGDTVTVSGVIDDALIGRPELEALTVTTANGAIFNAPGEQRSQTIIYQDHNADYALMPSDRYERTVATQTTSVSDSKIQHMAVGAYELTGEVASFNGMAFQMKLPDGQLVTVDTKELPFNPASQNVSPRLEAGDQVRLRADDSASAGNIVAREIVSVQKPYDARALTPAPITNPIQ